MSIELPDELKADDELLAKVRDHTKAHVDVYPFVLQMLNTVLRSAQECPSLGGYEPHAIRLLHHNCQEYIKAVDPTSVGFFDKSIYESPR